MTTLPDFLLARIAEDEAANDCHTVECGVDLGYWATGVCTCGTPARLLAELEVKRRIINACTWFDYERIMVRQGVYEQKQIRRVRSDDLDACAEVLWHMAFPYVNHPDYDEAWRV